MTEGMPHTPEEGRQLHRSLAEKVLDRVTSDPQWEQRLLDDPQAALREANFPEVQRLEELLRSARGSREGAEEVRGQLVDYSMDLSGGSLDPGPASPITPAATGTTPGGVSDSSGMRPTTATRYRSTW
jgi:hypothetical protein